MKLFIFSLVFSTQSFAFVLLSGANKATLPASPAQPTITFIWNGETPFIKNKEKIDDGVIASYSDADAMKYLLTKALDKWNNVRGSFLKLTLGTLDTSATIDRNDRINSIVVEKQESLTAAASAQPEFTDSTITDCDIQVGTNSISAESLEYTLIHEVGHCIGLGHAHSNYGAIMGYSRSQTSSLLGADDKAGIIYLYPDPTYNDSNPTKLACGHIVGNTQPSMIIGMLLLPLGLLIRRSNWRSH